jgi:Cytochrome c554 and c-prime
LFLSCTSGIVGSGFPVEETDDVDLSWWIRSNAAYRRRCRSGARANLCFYALFLFVFLAVWDGRGSVVAQELTDYAGDEACQSCHPEKVASYLGTPHHLTSHSPTKESILGSFTDNENILRTANPALHFRMESTPTGFYEKAVWMAPTTNVDRAERIDVVVGSGRVGQTYLYWKDDHLFQLPVSYWVDLGTWVNSPGYRDGAANFDRPVVPRCLECHTSYAAGVGPPASSNQYKRESLVLGISCERCHGSTREHVEAMRSKRTDVSIVRLTTLVRERQIDVCAQCHGGRRFPVRESFSYVPGEPLDEFYVRDPGSSASPDVHGNQVALLQMSRCYQASPQFNCTTCHDVHQKQRDLAALSDRCVKCHSPQTCGEFAKLKETIAKRCVDCHMPVQASNLIISNFHGKQTRAMVRSHWIKVYPDSASAVSLP